ncbi:MAG: M12 family metallo-peptidase [Pseudomonadales bacterium]|nr:M12 family metallo-peptidase [Pseudomonadales bacterium]
MGLCRIVLLATAFFCQIAYASTETLNVWLNDQVYTLSLNSHLPNGDFQQGDDAHHYQGKVLGIESSWTRISRIEDHWEGVVSVNGELFVVNVVVPKVSQRALSSMVISGTAAEHFHDLGNCELHEKPTDLSGLSSVSARSVQAVNAPNLLAASFSSLCSRTVDGICLLAEIDFVFDQDFQSKFPSNYESRATQLINIVDGYYRNELNMSFSVLNTTFLTSTVFTTSTDSATLLNDLTSKKGNGQLSFSSKDEALMHLVSGRDFDGDTVGLAWLEGLCDSTGQFDTGITQVVSNSISLTALVATHEIGHNLGAGHDGSGNSCGSGFIMAPALTPSASEFSTCSEAYIQTAIGNASNQDACFDYPFDIEISDSNSTSEVTSDSATRTFTVANAIASRSVSQATITGSISRGDGSFTSVSIDSTNCSIADGGQSYTCSLSSPSSNHNLSTTLSLSSGSYQISHSVSVTQSNLSETDSSNNSVTDVFTATISDPETPTEETPEESTEDSSGSDSSSSSSSSRSSGGGGGSLGIASLLLLGLAISRRRIAK